MPKARPRKYQCTIDGTCTGQFGSVSDRLRHERTHTGERPFTCEICHKSFPQATGLNTHRNTHTGHKPHKCAWCGQAFGDPSSKARHEKETHRCTGTYRCPADGCPVGIKRRSAFVKHLEQKHDLFLDKAEIEACAPVLRPKLPRKDQAAKRRVVVGGTPSVPASAHRLAQAHHTVSPITIPSTPSMGSSSTRVYDFSPDSPTPLPKYASPSDKDALPMWSEPPRSKQTLLSYYNADGSLGYHQADLFYNPPPSYSATLRGDMPGSTPTFSSQLGYHDPYSSPRSATPPNVAFPGSPMQEVTPTGSSTKASPVRSSLSQLNMPLGGSRPVTPIHGMNGFYDPYHPLYSEAKGPYGFHLYDGSPAPSVAGVNSVQG